MKPHKTPPNQHPKGRKPAEPQIARDPEREREQQALKRHPEGLIGDTATNRNLTGSTTWETLPDQDDEAEKTDRPKGR